MARFDVTLWLIQREMKSPITELRGGLPQYDAKDEVEKRQKPD